MMLLIDMADKLISLLSGLFCGKARALWISLLRWMMLDDFGAF